MSLPTNRTVGAAVAMSLLLVLAGCSGGFGPGGSSTTETTTTDPVETETTAADELTATDETTATNQTTVPSGENDSAASGRMLVVLDGRDAHLGNASSGNTSSGNASFRFDSDSHTWHASNESIAIADALSELGMDANESSLTYGNTTYEDGNETSVSYRVNGQQVEDLQSYEIEGGDQLFVTVHTSNATTPGQYYTANHPHPHGSLNVTVDGTPVNFTKQQYVHADRYFHFHGDEKAERWHAHSMNLTVEYALSSFPGMNVTNDSVTIDNTTYKRSDDGVEIDVTVNGESVDPSTYVLKNGDEIQVAVEETDST